MTFPDLYLILPTVLLLALPTEVNAQTGLVTFSSPDGSFRINVPRKPTYEHQVLNYENEGIFESNFRADVYDFSSPDSGVAGVLAIFYLARPRNRRQFTEECDSVMLVVGGDNKEFIKGTSVTVNGLHGREYFYRNGDIRGRVLIVNARTRVFFVQFHTEAGALPRYVERIFRSFRVAPLPG
jgi:hypothetical protein